MIFEGLKTDQMVQVRALGSGATARKAGMAEGTAPPSSRKNLKAHLRRRRSPVANKRGTCKSELARDSVISGDKFVDHEAEACS
jgi:hypothetical protein